MNDKEYLHFIWHETLDDKTENELWNLYKKLLNIHDWTWKFSSDELVQMIGSQEEEILYQIREQCAKFDREYANELYKYHEHSI